MKRTTVLVLIGLLLSFSGMAQERRTRTRGTDTSAQDNVITLSQRAQIKNEQESKGPQHVVWLREIYRNLDLTKDANAPLYYPVQPTDGRQNFATLIFKLLLDGKITAYNYKDGPEVLTEAEKVDLSVVLGKYQIPFTKQGDRVVVDERDIPSSDVTLYMIKEGYFFDEATGMYSTAVTAICPMLVREDYYSGGVEKDALFWVKYDDLRPYTSRELIMTSNYNNALTATIDDYFTKKLYDGEIVKTVNMLGRSLAQEVGSEPEKLKLAQDSIESQLQAFEKHLWVTGNDSTQVADKATAKKSKSKTSTKEKTEKPKAAKSENAAPVRSVRRR
jgi:gliding motility associated protien GldN